MNQEECVGYLKYSGESVDEGFLDARKSAEALLGFDGILRFFLLKEDPSLEGADFEIPVKVEKGSVVFWVAGIVITAYLTKMAQESATKGILNTATAKDVAMIVRGALISAQWVIKIGSHVGTLALKEFKSGLIDHKTQEVEILNTKNEHLRVPKRYLDIYRECPKKLFAKNAGIITPDRHLEIGIKEGSIIQKVSISEQEKSIYYSANEDRESDLLFPELKHGQFVDLEGTIVKVLENTNTIGFEYKGHMLTCKPDEKKLASYKNKIISERDDQILPKVRVIGKIDRTSENGEAKAKKPLVIFSEIISLETDHSGQGLF